MNDDLRRVDENALAYAGELPGITREPDLNVYRHGENDYEVRGHHGPTAERAVIAYLEAELAKARPTGKVRTLKAGPISVTVELPEDWPEDVRTPLSLDIHPATPEQARRVIAAMGGFTAFREPDSTDRTYGTFHLDTPSEFGDDERLPFEIWLPSGDEEERRPTLPPFVAEVYAEREKALGEQEPV